MRFDRHPRTWTILGAALCAVTGILLLGDSAEAGKSGKVVKVTATAGKIDAAGKQTVTLTLVMDKGWHIYANPVKNEDFVSIQTVVKVRAGVKLTKVDIQYPAGKLHVDKILPDVKWMEYEEKVVIPVVIQRAAGDVSPLEVDVSFSACNASMCLAPESVKNILK